MATLGEALTGYLFKFSGSHGYYPDVGTHPHIHLTCNPQTQLTGPNPFSQVESFSITNFRRPGATRNARNISLVQNYMRAQGIKDTAIELAKKRMDPRYGTPATRAMPTTAGRGESKAPVNISYFSISGAIIDKCMEAHSVAAVAAAAVAAPAAVAVPGAGLKGP